MLLSELEKTTLLYAADLADDADGAIMPTVAGRQIAKRIAEDEGDD